MRALAILLLACCAACGRTDERPHVLVLVADSLAAAHVSSHGCARPTTPAFDAFAEASVRFSNAGAAAAWTLPSIASLFTSQPQEVHGARDDELRLRSDLPTLAEQLRDAGWETRAIVQTPVLGRRTGVDRGFESYEVLDFSLASFDRALALARAAFDADPQVRINALYAIGRRCTMNGFAPALRNALTDPEEEIRVHAAPAFVRCAPRGEDSLVDLAQAGLRDANRYVVGYATETLERIGTPRAMGVLLPFLKTARWCPFTKSGESIY